MEAQPIRLGLLQYPVGRPASIADFAAALDRWLEEGRAQADLLVLPEYAAVELGAGLNGGEATEAAELAAMITAAPDILAAMRDAARRHRVWLQPGTLPMRAGSGFPSLPSVPLCAMKMIRAGHAITRRWMGFGIIAAMKRGLISQR